MLTATVIAGVAQYVSVQEEANELFDEQLRRIAGALAPESSAQSRLSNDEYISEHSAQSRPSNDEYISEHIVVQVWDLNGALVHSSRPQPQPRLETTGFNTVVVKDDRWRVYSETQPDRFIQVAQETAERDELMFKLSRRSLLPFLR